MNVIINIILFQAGWFACVISASQRFEWIAIGSIILIIVSHLYLVQNRWLESKIILSSGLTGMIVDSIMIANQVFTANHAIEIDNLAPLWLVGLWMLLGMTLNHSLAWFRNHLWLAAVAGFTFAPLAYFAGHRFGALQFSNNYDTYLGLLIIGTCWMLITPFLVRLPSLLRSEFQATQNN